VIALLALIAPAAIAIALTARPRSASAFAALTILAAWAILATLVDTLGRWRFDTATLAAALLAVGALGLAGLWIQRGTLPGAAREWARAWRAWRVATRPWPTRVLLAVWALVIAWSALSQWAMPATVPDVVRYHLPQIAAWARDGSVGVVPELDYRANYFPHAAQAPAAVILLLTGHDRWLAMPQVVYSGVLWPMVVFLVLRACVLRRRIALLGAMAASMTAPVILQMRVEMVDVAHAGSLLFALVCAIDGRRWFARPLIPFAIGAGLALGTKSTGPLVFAVLMGALAGGWIREGGLRALRDPGRWAGACGASLGAVLIGGWVYLANTLAHSNPLFPFYFSLGPVSFEGADPSRAIYHYAWIHDMGVDRIDRLIGGVARWPGLVLGVPPFDDLRRPGTSGFGWVVPVVTIVGAIGMAAALVRGRIGTVLTGGARAWILGALIVYSVLFVMNVSLVTAPWSTVDARYQLHLLVAIVIVFASVLAAVPMVWRTAIAWIIALVATPLAWVLIDDAPHRGLTVYTRMLERGEDRSWIYERGPFFVSNDMDRFRSIVGDDDPILLMGRGHAYPLMWPGFERTVLPVTTLGADWRLVDDLGVPPGIHEAALEVLREPGERARQWMDSQERWRAYSDTLTQNPTRAGRAYLAALADTHGVRWLYARHAHKGDEYPILKDNPDWELVWFDRGPTEARTMALYQRVRTERAADGP